MTTRKIFCLLALPAFLLCGEAAAGGNKCGGAPKQAASATAKTSTITVRKAGNGQQEYLSGVTSPAAKSSMAQQATGTIRTSPRQPNKVGTGCPAFACGSDGNGPQLTGIQGETVQELDKLATNGPKLTGIRIAANQSAGGNKSANSPKPQAAQSPAPKQTTGTERATRGQPNKVGGSCPPWACGSDSNGPQLTGIQGDTVQEFDKLATNGTQLSGLQAASGLIAVNTVTLASGEAIALR